MNIPQPQRISADFTFGNAAGDDSYRRVIYVDRDVVIPVELVASVVGMVAAIAVTVLVVVRRRQRA
ncbi:hypothetical protein [Mycobacterium sherrisii]|uniref:hypothetical protein n=1 Tax=Mycobacterium sherrisii TaxID=243061 RepID=UPI001E29B0F1|nr:hypothetical protein [Mycobacterium sherrisii]